MRFHFCKHKFHFKRVNNNAIVLKCKITLLSLIIYISDNKLCCCRQIKNTRFFNCPSSVIPDLILIVLTNCNDILVIPYTQLTVNHTTGMLIHIFYTFIILKIPHLYVALTYCY